MTTIKLRRGTAAEWATTNPVLNDGELGFERDTHKHKIGDGVTAWNTLKYFLAEDSINTLIDSRIGSGVHVTGAGTNDTAAVAAAITAAQSYGIEVHIAGTTVVDTVAISSPVTIRVLSGSKLKHKAASTNHMFVVTANRFDLIGPGVVDGNQANQTGRRYCVRAGIPNGTKINVDRINFINTQAAGVYGDNFGGELNVTNCQFSGMAEHDGVAGHWTCAVNVESGQSGQKGLCRFNHNTLIGTSSPAQVGGAPGGLFFAPVLDYANGVGNFSTLESTGNWFWGIGQDCSVNDISPIHTYPAVDAARVIGNYFEQSGFCAISAKSVRNFVCHGNVIVNGQTNAKNVATEGAISYSPGYHSGSVDRPRASIVGNVIDTPGGQSGVKQDGIVAQGVSLAAGGPSYATDFVIANNVITGAGTGIRTDRFINAKIVGNIIDGATGGTAGTELGIKATNGTGDLVIQGNDIKAPNGHGISAMAGLNTARVFLTNNKVVHSGSTTYAMIIRGVALAKFTGNSLDSTNAALSITTDGTQNVLSLIWDETNSIVAGSVSISWANVNSASGQLRGTNDPTGLVVAGEVGTTYRKTNGTGGVTHYVATAVGSANWATQMNSASNLAVVVNALKRDLVTASGSYTVPAATLVVRARGGGGGGGGGGSALTSGGVGTQAGAGGGGAGHWVERILTGLTVGDTLTVVIGGAGTSGTAGTANGGAGANGGSGGNTSVTGTGVSVIAQGGAGGAASAANSGTTVGGGAGNTRSTSSTAIPGGGGGTASTSGPPYPGGNCGGGGGGNSTGVTGGLGGNAGSETTNGTAGTSAGSGSSAGGNGGNATGYGGGGAGGGAGGQGGAGGAGGLGSAGLVEILWGG